MYIYICMCGHDIILSMDKIRHKLRWIFHLYTLFHVASPSQLVQAKKSWSWKQGNSELDMLGHGVFPLLYLMRMMFVFSAARHNSSYTSQLHKCTKLPNPPKKKGSSRYMGNDFCPLNPVGKSGFCLFFRPQQKGHEKIIFSPPSNGITAGSQTTESLQGVQACSDSLFAKILFDLVVSVKEKISWFQQQQQQQQQEEEEEEQTAHCKLQTTNDKGQTVVDRWRAGALEVAASSNVKWDLRESLVTKFLSWPKTLRHNSCSP